jgi:exodeoxyribonuclease VII small subunit
MATTKKELSFEAALKRLEELVEKMESGETDLDSMVKSFEEGRELVKLCTERLSSVERKVEELVKDSSGKVSSKSFSEEF